MLYSCMAIRRKRVPIIKPAQAKKPALGKPLIALLILVSSLAITFSLFLVTRSRETIESSVTGSPGAVNAPPEVLSASISPDKPTAGTPLVAQYSARSNDGETIDYVFKWFVDSGIAQEGPEATLAPGAYRKGASVFVELTPSNRAGAGKPFKTDAVTIRNSLPIVSSIALSPAEPSVGSKITAVPQGSDPDEDLVSYAYQWGVNEKALPDQKGSVFPTTGLKKKDMVYVLITPSDGAEAGEQKMSDVLVLVNSPPRITSLPRYELVNGIYAYQVTAEDPDGDKLSFRLEKSPAGMSIDAATGLIRWEAPKTVAGTQDVPINIVVDDGDGGTVNQSFSLILRGE